MNELCPYGQINREVATKINHGKQEVFTHYPNVMVELGQFINREVPAVLERAQFVMMEQIRDTGYDRDSLEGKWKEEICRQINNDIEMRMNNDAQRLAKFQKIITGVSNYEVFHSLSADLLSNQPIEIPSLWQPIIMEGAIIHILPYNVNRCFTQMDYNKSYIRKSKNLGSTQYYKGLLRRYSPAEDFKTQDGWPTVRCLGKSVAQHATLSATLNYGLVLLKKAGYITSTNGDGSKKSTHQILAEFKTIVNS